MNRFNRLAFLALSCAASGCSDVAMADTMAPLCCDIDGGMMPAHEHPLRWKVPPTVVPGMTYNASFDEFVRTNGDGAQAGECAKVILPMPTDADIGRQVGYRGIGSFDGCVEVVMSGGPYEQNGPMVLTSAQVAIIRFVWVGSYWLGSP